MCVCWSHWPQSQGESYSQQMAVLSVVNKYTAHAKGKQKRIENCESQRRESATNRKMVDIMKKDCIASEGVPSNLLRIFIVNGEIVIKRWGIRIPPWRWKAYITLWCRSNTFLFVIRSSGTLPVTRLVSTYQRTRFFRNRLIFSRWNAFYRFFFFCKTDRDYKWKNDVN